MADDALTDTRVTALRTRYVSRRMGQRAAFAVCAALLLGLVFIYASLLNSGNAGPKHTDFVPYYSAARLVAQGLGDRVYDLQTLGRHEAALVRPLKVKDGVMPYFYAPYFALALAPLGALAYDVAYYLWLIIDLLLLVISLAALQRFSRLSASDALLFWVAALSFLPVFVALTQGQTSIFLLAVFTATFLALRRGRDGLAGALLALSLVKAPYLAPILVVLAVRRRWRCLIALALSATGLLVVPMAIMGAGINGGFIHTLTSATGFRSQIGGFEPPYNHSFAGFSQLVLPGTASTVASLALSLAALCLLAVCAGRAQELDLPLGMAVVVGLLISPHVLVHDLTLLLLPIAVALRYRHNSPGHLSALLGLGYAAILVGLRLVFVVPLQLSVLVMSALAIWLFLASRSREERRATSVQPARRSAMAQDLAP